MDAVLTRITDQIRQSADQRTALCIRGSGSKDFYGEPPRGEVLDTGVYRGIVSYEPSELVITVRAGTPLNEVEAALTEKGQCLAFEPPHLHPSAGTCGGMVAVGLSGPSRASVGSVRDYVLGVQMINGRAEHLIFGGQVMKNVAGYDVSRMMVGSLGILGVLTEISLKVLPIAPAEATLAFEIDQPGALRIMHQWNAQPLPINASCWVKDVTTPGQPELLFVRLRGAGAAVDAAVRKMTQDIPGQRIDNDQARIDWDACRDLRLPFFTPKQAPQPQALWRLSVPQTSPAFDLSWPQLIEWHGAQRWLWAPVAAAEQLRQAARSVGGAATLFMAPAQENTPCTGRFDPLPAALAAIHTRLKNEFDPAGIFNPGRLYPSL